jgi:hypothetical protein
MVTNYPAPILQIIMVCVFVSCGKKYFEDEHLHFYNNIDECLEKEKPSAIILSSVIEYLEKPYELLADIINKDFEGTMRACAKREETWTKKVSEASKKYDDFDEVAFAEDLPIAPAMAAAMRDSDLGPDVAYYLGKNPSEAQRISQLSPAAQVREIGKIEARLEMKPVRQPSKAPPPIDPVGSGKGSSSVNLESMTQAEYEAYRAKTWAKRF